VLASDAAIYAQFLFIKPQLTWPELMAAGLHAYQGIDKSETQLCELTPRYGEFSDSLQALIFLVQQLSPQGKAEFASDLLLEDWGLNVSPLLDAPSTLIE